MHSLHSATTVQRWRSIDSGRFALISLFFHFFFIPFSFKTDYWHDRLAGKPYHISALFVVDLPRFRALAGGDILREEYSQNAKDKNSLANLDQDLPNMLQNKLPIFSLPQDWLWCGSWCSDASRKRARSIDLCNNPRTHEPKLAYAKRAIPV